MPRPFGAALRLLAPLVAILAAAACTNDHDIPASRSALAEPAPVSITPTPRAYRRIDLADAGLSVMVPAGWQQDAGATVWHPAPGDARALGIRVVTPDDPAHLPGLLPQGTVTAETPVALGWGSGTRYALRSARGAEAHVLIPLGTNQVVQAFITAPGVVELSFLQADLDRMLGSVVLRGAGASSSVPADPVTAATEAALQQFGAASGPGCAQPGADVRLCLTLQSTPAQVTRGIARFAAYNPATTEGYTVVLGRDPGGVWRVWVQAAATTYHAFDLPVTLRACVEGLTVRAEPNASAAATTTSSRGVELSAPAELFVLTEAATTNPPRPGAGWYKLSGDGWVYSREVTAATRPDCTVRDEWER